MVEDYFMREPDISARKADPLKPVETSHSLAIHQNSIYSNQTQGREWHMGNDWIPPKNRESENSQIPALGYSKWPGEGDGSVGYKDPDALVEIRAALWLPVIDSPALSEYLHSLFLFICNSWRARRVG
jgi:hypothetical protein